MYGVECHLLSKSPDFAIHKIVFFLEVLKGFRIKRNLLFKIEDILGLGNGDETVIIKTLLAVEKHARKTGWEGPIIKENPRLSFPSDLSAPKVNLIMPLTGEINRDLNQKTTFKAAILCDSPSHEEVKTDTHIDRGDIGNQKKPDLRYNRARDLVQETSKKPAQAIQEVKGLNVNKESQKADQEESGEREIKDLENSSEEKKHPKLQSLSIETSPLLKELVDAEVYFSNE